MIPLKEFVTREIYETIQFDHARLMKNITALMKAVGAEPGKCKGADCQKVVLFIRHANGKVTPYDSDGTNHYITCPNANQFRK